MKIMVIGAYPDSLVKFRGAFIRELVERGHEVHAVAGGEGKSVQASLEIIGASYSSIPLQRKGLNPFVDCWSLFSLYWLFKTKKPDIVFTYTVKPVIWGGLAAFLAGVPARHAMITGLGGQFDSRSRLHAVFSKIVGLLYKVSLSKYQNVIFQNSDDVATLLEKRILKPSQMHVVNGSGVGLDEYPQAPLPSEPIVFLSIARYLVAKGIREYAQAAREIKKTNPNIIFRLVGFEETGKTAIPIAEIRQLHDEGIIEAVGKVDNAYNQLEQCHIYVLASFYGEGLPRTILEAMAVGRPILTTNNVGCREAVVEGVNGKLVEPKSAETLASGMRWFLDNPQQWQAMASASREMAENKYDVRIVNAEMRRIMDL